MANAVGADSTNGSEEDSTDRPMGEAAGGLQVSCPSLAGGLGALCVILAILLVGVVVWSCQRRKGSPTQSQER